MALVLLDITACGTILVSVDETATPGAPLVKATSTESAAPSIQEQLDDLQDTETLVHIWGDLRSRVQPATGTLMDIDNL